MTAGIPVITGRGVANRAVRGTADNTAGTVGRHTDDAAEAANGLIGKVKGLSPEPNWRQSAADSGVLARNLGIKAGSDLDAHHIVAGTHGRAADARAMFNKYQIDINDAANGVPLVGGRGAPAGQSPRHHRGGGLHSYAGIDAVTGRLRGAVEGVDDWAKGRDAMINELGSIRQEISDGKFPPSGQ